MKYLTVKTILLALIQIATINCFSQERNKFTLNCEFKSLTNKSNAYLVSFEGDTIGHSISQDDRVSFSGILPDGGRYAHISFANYVSQFPTEGFFLMPGKYKIEGSLSNQSYGRIEIYVSGSKETDSINAFFRYSNIKRAKYDELKNEYQTYKQRTNNTTENDLSQKSKIDSVGKIYYEEITNWLNQHSTSPIVPFIMAYMTNKLEVSQMKKIENKLPSNIKNSYYGRLLSSNIESANTYNNIHHGKIVPNFPLVDTNGNKTNLIDAIKGHKLILLDFWASWCVPCRNEIPKLQAIRSQLKDKNFEIIGLSIDSDMEKWITAVKKDQSGWKHFHTIQGENFRKAFGINSIPAYMLLDGDGNMIAYDCRNCIVESFGITFQDNDVIKKITDILSSL